MTVAPIENSLGLKSIEIAANLYSGCKDGYIDHFVYGCTHLRYLKILIFSEKCILLTCPEGLCVQLAFAVEEPL